MFTKRDSASLGAAGMAVAGTPALSAYKVTNAFSYLIKGLAYLKAATDNIVWTIFVTSPVSVFTSLAASQQSIFFFFVDAAGAMTVRQGPVVAGTTGATYTPGAFEWPGDDATRACVGAVKVNCNASGAFVPGTTALNAANQTSTFYNAALDYGVPITY